MLDVEDDVEVVSETDDEELETTSVPPLASAKKAASPVNAATAAAAAIAPMATRTPCRRRNVAVSPAVSTAALDALEWADCPSPVKRRRRDFRTAACRAACRACYC